MLKGAETIDDDRVVAKCYVELGDVTKEKGEYDESIRYHRRSLEIFEKIADLLSAADSHLNIAGVYKAKGELKQAMTEYEKGLTLYEGVFTDDATRNNDSGAELSLNSSTFSDLQYTRSMSKSDECLPQLTSTLVDNKQDELRSSGSLSHNSLISGSTSALDQLVSSTKTTNDKRNSLPRTTSLKSPTSSLFGQSRDKIIESFSSSCSSNIHSMDENDMLSPVLPSDPVREMVPEDLLEQNKIFEPNFSCQSDYSLNNVDLPLETAKQSSSDKYDNNDDELHNSDQLNSKHEVNVSNDQNQIDRSGGLCYRLLIVVIVILFTGAILWSLRSSSIKSLLVNSSNHVPGHKTSQHYNNDDLYEQIRKILPWRKDRVKLLNKSNQRTLERFLHDAENRTHITIDRFQQILDLLDLRIVLIPR